MGSGRANRLARFFSGHSTVPPGFSGRLRGIGPTAFRTLRGATTRRRLAVSGLLVALTVAFEVVIGGAVDHRSCAELAANCAFWEGRLWPAVLLVVALTPFLWGRAALQAQRQL